MRSAARRRLCFIFLLPVVSSLHAVVIGSTQKSTKALCTELEKKGCSAQIWDDQKKVTTPVSHVFDLSSASFNEVSDVMLKCINDDFQMWIRVKRPNDTFENDFFQGPGFTWCILDANTPELAAQILGHEHSFRGKHISETQLAEMLNSESEDYGIADKTQHVDLVQANTLPKSASLEVEEDTSYAALTVAKLKAILKERGLKVSGKKAELILRLLEDDHSG
mmetsp:Transcript_23386/g.30349  ORF Transcript_23386/g.30349 Transcript_23386/m.30349 type:complete len:222 (-) Transcript_23386:534-1199(-)